MPGRIGRRGCRTRGRSILRYLRGCVADDDRAMRLSFYLIMKVTNRPSEIHSVVCYTRIKYICIQLVPVLHP